MKDAMQDRAAVHDPTGMVTPGHDLKQLGRDIEALRAMQRELAGSDRLERLLKITPRPGWTTPAELLLMSGHVQHMADTDSVCFV